MKTEKADADRSLPRSNKKIEELSINLKSSNRVLKTCINLDQKNTILERCNRGKFEVLKG